MRKEWILLSKTGRKLDESLVSIPDQPCATKPRSCFHRNRLTSDL